ncbi:MAG: N-acetylneuraminic acid mutarotase [Vicingaceae bacterium]
MHKTLLVSFLLISTSIFAQTWVQQANMPSPRHHPITFSLNGMGYSATGSTLNNQVTNDFYDYNPITNTWGTMPSFPGPARSFGISTLSNGKAYLGFGVTRTQYLKDFWSFDATDSSWTQLASCVCNARRHPAMVSTGNKIYVGLGNDASGDLNDWWMYDIIANTWMQISDLPGIPRHHPFMFNAGGEVFAGMGHGGGIIHNDWYKLDTATNSWTTMSPFPGEARVAGTQFEVNGYGYVLSGDGSNHSFMSTGEMWRYDPNGDSWMQMLSHPNQSRWAPGSFVINDEVYFFGGLNRATNLFPNESWKFDLTDTTSSINEIDQVLENTFIYPNPSSDFIFWKSHRSISDVRVYNGVGQLVFTSAANVQRMDVNGLNDGLYFVQFFDRTKIIKTSKVLIQR